MESHRRIERTSSLETCEENSLVKHILSICNNREVFSDIIVHQNSCLTKRTPSGMKPVSDYIATKDDIERFFKYLEPSWESKIESRAFDRGITTSGIRFRANCFSFESRARLGCVLRPFPLEPIPLSTLGLRQNVMSLKDLTHGLVLIVGDTSQGKSTTIASFVDAINSERSGHILTIEDPVETIIPPRKSVVTQREVGMDADVESFHIGVIDALRERADVVLIGEIRDAMTAQEAVSLAESGPLVFATLHARSVELGIQKLLRLIGNTEQQRQSLANVLQAVLCQALLSHKQGHSYVLATEFLTVTDRVADAICADNLAKVRSELNQSSKGTGANHSMNESLVRLYREGKIDEVSALRATTDRIDLLDMIKPHQPLHTGR